MVPVAGPVSLIAVSCITGWADWEHVIARGDMVMVAPHMAVADANYDAIENAVLTGRLTREGLDEAVAGLQALPATA